MNILKKINLMAQNENQSKIETTNEPNEDNFQNVKKHMNKEQL